MIIRAATTCLLLALAAALSPLAAAAQTPPPAAQEQPQNPGVVSGRVTDASTGAPLKGAIIRFVDLDRFVETGSNGFFLMNDVPAGFHAVKIELIGYNTQSDEWALGSGRETSRISMRVALEPQPVVLEALRAVTYGLNNRLRSVAQPVRVFEGETMPTRWGRDAKAFVARVANFHPVPCDQLGLNLGPPRCVRIRGMPRMPTVSVDDKAATYDDLEQLIPEHIERVEIFSGGAHIRVYTTWYMEWLAQRPEHRAVPLPITVPANPRGG